MTMHRQFLPEHDGKGTPFMAIHPSSHPAFIIKIFRVD